MTTLELLKVLHLVGVGLLFMSLGGLCVNALLGNGKEELKGKGWMLVLLSFKGGLLITIGAGLGTLFESGGSMASGGWVHAKLTLWLVIAVVGMMVIKRPAIAKALWIALPLLLGAAAWLAGTQPF